MSRAVKAWQRMPRGSFSFKPMRAARLAATRGSTTANNRCAMTLGIREEARDGRNDDEP